jgi:hypothetical protein
VSLCKGTPIKQAEYIVTHLVAEPVLNIEPVFCLEMPHHFQNANTTRSLLERYGYIKNVLLGAGFKVREPNLNSARAWLGVKDKQAVLMHYIPYFAGGAILTSDHADALLMAQFQASKDGIEPKWEELKIYQGEYA